MPCGSKQEVGVGASWSAWLIYPTANYNGATQDHTSAKSIPNEKIQ